MLDKRVSVLDLLRALPVLPAHVRRLPARCCRRCARASTRSPRRRCGAPTTRTLTLAVLSTRPRSPGHGLYQGTASTHLAHARPGSRSRSRCGRRTWHFHPPASLQTPIVLVCAGTGLAPFRGFLQDRALAAQEAGAATGSGAAVLRLRRTRTSTTSTRDELAAWAEQGVVDVRPAFSAAPDDGVRYVQDRIWADRDDVRRLIQEGAHVLRLRRRAADGTRGVRDLRAHLRRGRPAPPPRRPRPG